MVFPPFNGAPIEDIILHPDACCMHVYADYLRFFRVFFSDLTVRLLVHAPSPPDNGACTGFRGAPQYGGIGYTCLMRY